MARKQREFNGNIFSDDGSGKLYNAKLKKYLIYRPYPMLVDQVNESYVEPDNKQEYTSKELKNKFGTDNTDIINTGKELEEQVSKKIEEESEEKDYNTGMFAFNKPEQQNLKLYSEELKESQKTDDPYGVKSMLTEDLEQTEYDFTEESLNNPERKAVEEELVKRYEEEGDKVKYSQSFHLESPVKDIDEAQDYLSRDDMTQYVPDELKEVITKAEWVLDDEESGNINIETTRQLTQYEQSMLSDWISGQNSDGLGEGFEQQDFSGGYYDPDSGEGPYSYNEVVDIVSRNYDNMDFEDYQDHLDHEDIRHGLENYLRDGYYDQSFEDFMIERASEISDEADLDGLREEFENTSEDVLHDRYYQEYEDWLDSEEESFIDSGYAEEYIPSEAISYAKDEAAKEDSRYNENLWEDSMSSIKSDRPGFRSEFINEEEKSDFYNRLSDEEKSKYDNYLKQGYSKTDIEDTLMYKTWDQLREEYDNSKNDEENTSGYKEGDKVMFHGYETTILQVKNDPRWGPDYLIRGEEGNIWTDGSHFDRVESQETMSPYSNTNNVISQLKSADKYSSIDIQGSGNYHISKYDDGAIQISSSHPYDLSDYSFAKWSNMNNTFSIYDSDGKLVDVVNTIEEAVEKMREIDKNIKARIDRT